MGDWTCTIQAWTDPFAAWREELERKIAFGEPDLTSELQEGALMLREAGERAKGDDATIIAHALKTLEDGKAPASAKYDAALGTELFAAVEASQPRHECTTMEPQLTLEVDRVRARFSTWYELFPRSWGGFQGVTEQMPKIAELGFDVLYLPPIHPIGEKNRKGRNNAVKAGEGRPGRRRGRSATTSTAATRRSTPSWAPSTDFKALVATAPRARHRDRARLGAQRAAPTTRG